jgi:hypothetical protein
LIKVEGSTRLTTAITSHIRLVFMQFVGPNKKTSISRKHSPLLCDRGTQIALSRVSDTIWIWIEEPVFLAALEDFLYVG